MIQFFKRFTVFSIILTITLFTLQIIVSNIIDNKSINGQDNLDQTTGKKSEVLFFGSSRILASINPKILLDARVKSENLGSSGQGIRFAIARYRNYLAKNHKSPKIIVCSMEPLFESGDSRFEKDRFARYCWNANPNDTPILNYFKFNWCERNIPLYALLKYRKIWDCIFLNNRSSWLKEGMEIPSSNSLCATSPKRFDFNTIKYNLNQIETQIQIFKNLAETNSAKLIFIQLPFYRYPIDSPNNQFELTEHICKKFK